MTEDSDKSLEEENRLSDIVVVEEDKEINTYTYDAKLCCEPENNIDMMPFPSSDLIEELMEENHFVVGSETVESSENEETEEVIVEEKVEQAKEEEQVLDQGEKIHMLVAKADAEEGKVFQLEGPIATLLKEQVLDQGEQDSQQEGPIASLLEKY